MKVWILLILSIIIAACTGTEEVRDERERVSREPVIYRSYIEEGSENYLEDINSEEEGRVYYRNYRGD